MTKNAVMVWLKKEPITVLVYHQQKKKRSNHQAHPSVYSNCITIEHNASTDQEREWYISTRDRRTVMLCKILPNVEHFQIRRRIILCCLLDATTTKTATGIWIELWIEWVVICDLPANTTNRYISFCMRNLFAARIRWNFNVDNSLVNLAV